MRALALAVALVATVAIANYATSTLGLVPAGFGLMVTAGTFAAGLALGLRDGLHEAGGPRWVLGAIAVGCALSFVLGDGRIALASAVAFAVAELADFAVYTPLRRRTWRLAVVASNAVGAIADTLLFLTLAGFPLTWASVGGQFLVKAVWCTALVIVTAEVIRRAVPRERLQLHHS